MPLPEPYYQDESVALYHGDFMRFAKHFPLAWFDLILADPPYGETSLDWDTAVDGWPYEAARLVKPSGSLWCFGSLRSFMFNQPEFREWLLAQDVIWEKHNGSIFHADRFRRVHEHVVQFYRTTSRWAEVYKNPVFTHDATKHTARRKERPPHTGEIESSTYTSFDGGPRLMRSVIQVRSCHGYADHPTQKPIGILTPLIEYACPPGGLILDPFAGSGSTLLAAKLLGRKAIGIEIHETYCRAAVRRLQQAVLPLTGD